MVARFPLDRRDVTKAFLLSPLIVPVTGLAHYLVGWVSRLANGVLEFPFTGLVSAGGLSVFVMIFVVYGIPIAYLALLAWGLPTFFLLHRLNRLRLPFVAGTGAIGGILTCVVISHGYGSVGGAVSFAISGMGVAAAFWWLAVGHYQYE